MRRTYLLLGILAALGAAGAFVFRTTATTAAPKAAVARDNTPKVALPLTHVVLFSSGVDYFQREGVVEGDARSTRRATRAAVRCGCADGVGATR